MAINQDMNVRQLGDLLPARSLPIALAATPVSRLVLDSRQVQSGDTFIAVPGVARDGRDFIGAAIAAGASLVLAESRDADAQALVAEASGAATILYIPSLSLSLSAIAAAFYGAPFATLPVTGVTGTNGKTSFAFWFAHLSQLLGKPAAMFGTLGCGLITQPLADTGMTTPDAITLQALLAQSVAAGAEAAVLEVSSHSLDQHRVAGLAIDVAVFTNLTRDHLDYHGTEQAYKQAKLKLMAMPSVNTVVLNRDDAAAEEFAAAAVGKRVWYYSRTQQNADFVAENIVFDQLGVSFDLRCQQGVFPVKAPVMGDFNVSNLLAVIAAAHAHGYGLTEIIAAVAALPAVPGRMQRVDVASDITVLVDYAHTPDALASVLRSARRHTEGQLCCVFGCGGDRDTGKRPQMGRIAEAMADRVVITSDNPRSEDPLQIIAQIQAGLHSPAKAAVIADRAAAIATAIAGANSGDCVVLAGKGHETYQQIGSDKLPFDDMICARLALQQRNGGDL